MHGSIFQPIWNGSERSKYLWNQKNRPNLSEHILHPEHTSMCACMHSPVYKAKWVRSERSKYLWNQENILDLLSTKFDLSMQACMHTNWVGSKNQGIIGIREACQIYLSTYHDPSTQASMHACYILACIDHIMTLLNMTHDVT